MSIEAEGSTNGSGLENGRETTKQQWSEVYEEFKEAVWAVEKVDDLAAVIEKFAIPDNRPNKEGKKVIGDDDGRLYSVDDVLSTVPQLTQALRGDARQAAAFLATDVPAVVNSSLIQLIGKEKRGE